MDILQAAILGVVEGITEFLPISSTGHLILASKLLGLEQTEFLKSFEIAIQLGAIFSVLALYWRRLLVDARVMVRVAAAFVPTAVLGFGLYKIVKKYLLSSETVVLWALLVGGIVLILFERAHKEEKSTVPEDIALVPFRNCVMIGVFQALAMIPGVSRSGATVIGGLAMGWKRKTIVEFSFLLAVPTMAAATGYDLLKSASSWGAAELKLLAVGAAVSFVVAILAIKFFLKFVQNHTFVPFGIYRIAAALAFWAFVAR